MIKKEAAQTKEAKDDVVNYYSEGYVYNRYAKLQQEQSEIESMVVASKQTTAELITARTTFINEIGNFRKALTNGRYSILDRFKRMCSDAKNGLGTLFVILLQGIRRVKMQF